MSKVIDNMLHSIKNATRTDCDKIERAIGRRRKAISYETARKRQDREAQGGTNHLAYDAADGPEYPCRETGVDSATAKVVGTMKNGNVWVVFKRVTDHRRAMFGDILNKGIEVRYTRHRAPPFSEWGWTSWRGRTNKVRKDCEYIAGVRVYYDIEAFNRWQEEIDREWRRARTKVAADFDPSEHTVFECRKQLQKHHPDKGGDVAEFHLWTKRLKLARKVA